MESKPERRLDPYEELRVARDASADTIKRAYRRRSSKAHSDRGGSTEEMQRVNRAYALLGSPDARSRYDRGEADAPKHTPESQAQTILATLWSQAIEKFVENPPDLLKHIETVIMEGQVRADQEIANSRKILRKLERIRKYLKPNKQSIGTLESVLNEKIRVMEGKIKANEEMKALGPLILEFLHTYGWEGPPPKAESSVTFGNWNFTP